MSAPPGTQTTRLRRRRISRFRRKPLRGAIHGITESRGDSEHLCCWSQSLLNFGTVIVFDRGFLPKTAVT